MKIASSCITDVGKLAHHKYVGRYELNCVPQKCVCLKQALTPNKTVFRDGAFVETRRLNEVLQAVALMLQDYCPVIRGLPLRTMGGQSQVEPSAT